ncbi:MAG: hypothetical protein WCG97_01265 [bacterium]
MKHTIYKSREFLRPSQIVHKKRIRKVLKLAGVIFIFGLIVGCFIFLMRTDFFKIQHVDVKGNVSLKGDDLALSVNKIISGNYLYFLPKNNILIFPKSEMLKELRQQFPRIDILQITVEKNNLTINMTERKPHTLWCGASFSQSVDPCSFVDSQGFVFALAPQFDGSSYLKLYGSMPQDITQGSTSTADILPMDAGTYTAWQFIPAQEYSDIETFLQNVKELGIELNAVEISDATTYRFQIKNNGLLLVVRGGNLANALDNLKAGLTNPIFWTTQMANKNEIGIKKLTQIDYIDLRFGNKIFYKLMGR